VRVIKFVGPTLANTLKNIDGGLDLQKIKNVEDLKVTVIGNIVEEISEAISEEALDYFCDVFGATTLVSAKQHDSKNLVLCDTSHQELHFMGAYDRFLKWLWFCLQVNFSGFTKGLSDLATKASASTQAGQAATESK